MYILALALFTDFSISFRIHGSFCYTCSLAQDRISLLAPPPRYLPMSDHLSEDDMPLTVSCGKDARCCLLTTSARESSGPRASGAHDVLEPAGHSMLCGDAEPKTGEVADADRVNGWLGSSPTRDEARRGQAKTGREDVVVRCRASGAHRARSRSLGVPLARPVAGSSSNAPAIEPSGCSSTAPVPSPRASGSAKAESGA